MIFKVNSGIDSTLPLCLQSVGEDAHIFKARKTEARESENW